MRAFLVKRPRERISPRREVLLVAPVVRAVEAACPLASKCRSQSRTGNWRALRAQEAAALRVKVAEELVAVELVAVAWVEVLTVVAVTADAATAVVVAVATEMEAVERVAVALEAVDLEVEGTVVTVQEVAAKVSCESVPAAGL